MAEASKEKEVFARGNSAEVEDQKGSTEGINIQRTPVGCLLGHFPWLFS